MGSTTDSESGNERPRFQLAHWPEAAADLHVPADLHAPAAMLTHAARVARLTIDARYDLERRDLYRAKSSGPHAASAERLLGLELAYDVAAARLTMAEQDAAADMPPPGRRPRHLRLVPQLATATDPAHRRTIPEDSPALEVWADDGGAAAAAVAGPPPALVPPPRLTRV